MAPLHFIFIIERNDICTVSKYNNSKSRKPSNNLVYVAVMSCWRDATFRSYKENQLFQFFSEFDVTEGPKTLK